MPKFPSMSKGGNEVVVTPMPNNEDAALGPIVADMSSLPDSDFDVAPAPRSGGMMQGGMVSSPDMAMRSTSVSGNNSRSLSAGGSVEIFDIDSGSMPMPNYGSGGNGQIGVMSNSSVTVYPIDGGMSGMAPMASYDSGFNTGFNGGASAGGDAHIYFKHGSSRLGSGDLSKLRNVAQQAKSSVGRVNVEGFASQRTQTNSTVRSKVLNLKESMNRSFAVSKNLIEKGVPANKIKTVSWGDAQSTGSEGTDRRVDVRLNGQ